MFGSLYGGIGVAAALSYLLGGLLLDRTTPRVAFVAAEAAGLLATGATAVALRRGRGKGSLRIFPQPRAKGTFIAVGAPANGGGGWASVAREWSSERCWWR